LYLSLGWTACTVEMGGACRTYEAGERCIKVLVGKPEGKRLLERSSQRWKIILKWMSLK